MKGPTIIDVAERAGVSKSTVSRILNQGLAVRENESVRRVRAAAEELGYRRDASAVNLRLGRTGTIGVVVTHLADVVRAMFFEEVTRAARATGRFAIAAGIEGEGNSERDAVELLLRQGVDGLILTTTVTGDSLPAELRARGVPHVLALRSLKGTASVVGDDGLGGELAARHLLSLGHRRIAAVSGPAGASTVAGRLRGYRRAMAAAGCAVPAGYVVPATFGAESGRAAALRLMALPTPPTAIFAVNDVTAIGVISGLSSLGVRVPDDVSVVGYSDIPIVRHLPAPLTTIRVPYDEIAREAVMLLADGKTVGRSVIEPALIVRSSTAPPAPIQSTRRQK